MDDRDMLEIMKNPFNSIEKMKKNNSLIFASERKSFLYLVGK